MDLSKYNPNRQFLIYKTDKGDVKVDVLLQNETIWLPQNKIAELFDVQRPAITKHLKNIFESGELDEKVVCSILELTTQHGAIADKTQTKPTKFYNLDAIIAVGYRVNSKNATAFRRWANRILKDYIVKGYAINNSIVSKKYEELCHLVQILGRTVNSQPELTTDESHELISVVSDYTYALDTLDRYDYQQLTVEQTTQEELFHATYDNAMAAIQQLKVKFGGSRWFGNEKDDSFKSSVGQIYQTFGGVDLYPSVEEKAAMLLYLVTKNHSFSDGNKRIAATLFLWFMQNNGILYDTNRRKRISDGTLVALTLMIAESRTEEKDTMVKVVVNLINKNCTN